MPFSILADSLRRTHAADGYCYRIQEYIKARLFLDGNCCFRRMGWRSQRQSEKSQKLETLAFCPLGRNAGVFCVLAMVVSSDTVGFLSQDCNNSPPSVLAERRFVPLGLSATNRFLVPANAMPVRQQGVPTILDPCREDHRTHAAFAAAEFSGRVRRSRHNRKHSSHAASY